MEQIVYFFNNFFILLNAMSIYVIVGLLVAGILKQIIPKNFISSHLGKSSIGSAIKATLLGIPLPICSCSVIPLAQGLRKEGASKGAVQSFLISTPITGIDSILATYSFFGIIFTFFRLISSIIIAITVGIIQNFISNEKNEKKEQITQSCNCSQTKKTKFSYKKAFLYGYDTLFGDMAKTLLVGLILGSLFVTFAPQEYTSILFENKLLTYIVVILFSMPLYICATASLPLAAAFMMQGMPGGAVFIFLTAGPATSSITISVVYKLLGKTSLAIYLIVIFIMSFLFGYIYDTFFTNSKLNFIPAIHENISIFHIFASIIMICLIFYHIIKQFIQKKHTNCCS